MLLVQLLVLAFTGALWWIARRDLAARIPPPVSSPPAAETEELEQLCATLETLVTSLARRLEVVERRAVAGDAAEYDLPAFGPRGHLEPSEPASHAELAADPRYLPVYALLESGISDPVEIARQTGLGRGEVDLILSLRDRRAF